MAWNETRFGHAVAQELMARCAPAAVVIEMARFAAALTWQRRDQVGARTSVDFAHRAGAIADGLANKVDGIAWAGTRNRTAFIEAVAVAHARASAPTAGAAGN